MNKLNKRNYKKGAALTEFVILTTIMIPLLLYVSFFSELMQFRMKIDEMGYFASWEMASYGLSNYKGNAFEDIGDENSGVFKDTITKIQAKTYDLYQNLDSADPDRAIGYIMLTPKVDTLNVVMKPANNIIDNQTINDKDGGAGGAEGDSSAESGGETFGKILNGIDSFLAKGINFVLGEAFGFNTKATGATSTASGGFSVTERMKTNIGTKDAGGFSNAKLLREDMISGVTVYKAPSFTVWTDTWTVKSGENIINTKAANKCQNGIGKIVGCENMPYARQVERMSLIGTWTGGYIVRTVVNAIGSGFMAFLQDIPYIGQYFKDDEYPAEARMASINYYYDSSARGPYIIGDPKFPDNGKIEVGQKEFHTTPLVNIFRNGAQTHEGIKEYKETLEKRRNFYMGHDKPNCKYTGLHESCQ